MQNFRSSHLFPQASFDSTESRFTAETANVRTLEAKTTHGRLQFLDLTASNVLRRCERPSTSRLPGSPAFVKLRTKTQSSRQECSKPRQECRACTLIIQWRQLRANWWLLIRNNWQMLVFKTQLSSKWLKSSSAHLPFDLLKMWMI